MSRIGRPPEPLANRFTRYVRKSSFDECWVWTGAKDKDGYGKIRLTTHDAIAAGNQTARAARVAWFLAHGSWPSSSQMVLHSCDNPACVRPDHLFLGDHRLNMADMTNKGRSAGARGTWTGGPRSPENARLAKLNWAKVSEIRAAFATETITHSLLAKRYGVSPETIGDVLRFRTWIR